MKLWYLPPGSSRPLPYDGKGSIRGQFSVSCRNRNQKHSQRLTSSFSTSIPNTSVFGGTGRSTFHLSLSFSPRISTRMFFFLRKMAFFAPIALLCDFGRCSQHELETYLSKKHDKLLSGALRPKSYRKRFSMAIVDGFAVEMTDEQVAIQLSTNR